MNIRFHSLSIPFFLHRFSLLIFSIQSMLFPSPSFPFHYPLVQLPDVHIKVISFISDALYRCDHVHTLCIRLISLSRFEDTRDSRRRFPTVSPGVARVVPLVMIGRLYYSPGTFDKRLTAACFSPVLVLRIQQCCRSFPFVPRLVPLFPITDLSSLHSKREISAKMASALIGLRYFVFGTFPSQRGPKDLEPNLTDIHPSRSFHHM